MCFFVDGLDECEGIEESGEHRAMVDFLMSTTSPFVKVCLSSRPWRIFAEILDQCPRLRLQDLTEPDIRIFVTDELVQNGRMKSLQELGAGLSTEFVDEIVYRAEGVFLWVTLVLKSIVNGIGRHETVTELKNRLRRLPSGLKDLYDHMFTRIDPCDMQKAAQIIQIFEALDYHMSVMRLGFALETTYEKAICDNWEEWNMQDLASIQKRTAATIESTCLGFIEIHDACRASNREPAENDVCDTDSAIPFPSLFQALIGSRLFYVHRTVREYVQREEIERKILLHTHHIKDFDPVLSNRMASVLLCKVLPAKWHYGSLQTSSQLGVYSRGCGW